MNTFQKTDFEKYVIDRLSNLETHLINFILPLQQINSVADKLNKPIVLDDRRIFNTLKEFREAIETLIGFFKIADIDKINEGLSPFINNLEKLNQSLGEIKYIGKRLNEIEKSLQEIKNNGIEKKVRVDLTLDGHEMIKKRSNYYSKNEVYEPEEYIALLLNSLDPKDAELLVYRVGLLDEKPKTFNEIGKLLNISRERASIKFTKVLEKLKHPSRLDLVKKSNHNKLNEWVRNC